MSHFLPRAAGIGLRLPHIRQILNEQPDVAWFEIHAENFFGGGANLAALHALRTNYPISIHGVGLGLGSAEQLDDEHLRRFRQLIDMIEPAAVSEHLCWNRLAGEYFNDLLPLPYTEEALDWMVRQVGIAQDALGRRLLIENLSSYLSYSEDTVPEGEFLAELARRSGCGLLVDVNNLFVTEHNLGRPALLTLDTLPAEYVGEIHIAGYEVMDDGLWLDSHGAPVVSGVWALLDAAIQRFGPVPVLLERDTHLPTFADLQTEAVQIDEILDRHREHA